MEDFKQRYIAARRAVIAQDLSRLNPMQRQAAMTTEGPLLLLAGAGSGKTTVLIQRVYNLLTYGRGSDSEEVPAWATEEDLQFLESFPARPTEEDVRRALHTGAWGLYHLCCHNFLHGRSREAVAEACKAAVFLLQAKLYVEQGLYCRRRSDLEQHLTGQDLEILQTAQALKAGECREDLTALTDRLFAWCRDVIGQQKAI